MKDYSITSIYIYHYINSSFDSAYNSRCCLIVQFICYIQFFLFQTRRTWKTQLKYTERTKSLTEVRCTITICLHYVILYPLLSTYFSYSKISLETQQLFSSFQLATCKTGKQTVTALFIKSMKPLPPH